MQQSVRHNAPDTVLTPEQCLQVVNELRHLRHPHADSNAWREILAALNDNQVEYLVVGALAVAFHGYPRYTDNLDVLIRAIPGHLHVPPRVNLMTSIPGVSFDDAWAGRSSGAVDGIPVYFIGRDALLRSKESTGRDRDSADAEELRRRAVTA